MKTILEIVGPRIKGFLLSQTGIIDIFLNIAYFSLFYQNYGLIYIIVLEFSWLSRWA